MASGILEGRIICIVINKMYSDHCCVLNIFCFSCSVSLFAINPFIAPSCNAMSSKLILSIRQCNALALNRSDCNGCIWEVMEEPHSVITLNDVRDFGADYFTGQARVGWATCLGNRSLYCLSRPEHRWFALLIQPAGHWHAFLGESFKHTM